VIGVPPRWCAVLAATVALVGAAIARADAPVPEPPAAIHFFAADTSEAGVISLYFFGAEGAPVEYFERVGDRLQPLGTRTSPRDTATAMKQAVTWRCARLVRRFEATSTLPDGTRATGAYSVRTPSCGTRFELGVPRRLAPGSRAAIRVVDRWGNGGVSPQLCIAAPHGSRACRRLRLRRAVTVVTRRVRVTTPGRWRVELRIGAHRVRRSIAVGVASTATAAPPKVLATGDSMMQGIDSFLADELGAAATVQSEVLPGTAISKPRTPWTRLPRSQTRRLRQDVTVVAIGANEGFPMTLSDATTRACCGTGWIAEYGRRVRADMRTYRRKGRGRVIWLTLPIPRGPRVITDAVNLAVEQAAVGLARVTVLRLDLFFTPDGFRDVMSYRGRDVRVRERDGIHLNVPGTAIAAKLVAAAVRQADR
jgi:lysophospholipase L1-like esterase